MLSFSCFVFFCSSVLGLGVGLWSGQIGRVYDLVSWTLYGVMRPFDFYTIYSMGIYVDYRNF